MVRKDKVNKVRTNKLTIEGGGADNLDADSWQASCVVDDHILLSANKERSFVSFCTQRSLYDVLLGCYRESWSGEVKVQTPDRDVRSLYFSDGEIVFAASSLIDERLGNVIYRQGFLTLEELTKSAIAVNTKMRFGQALVKNNSANFLDIWDYLSMQMQEIAIGAFIAENSFVTLIEDKKADTFVRLEGGTEKFIAQTFLSGLHYRKFINKLDMKSQIKVIGTVNRHIRKNNTFFSDEVQNILVHDMLVEDFLDALKLGSLCSMRVLADFVFANMCVVDTDDKDLGKNIINKDMKKLFNTYNLIVGKLHAKGIGVQIFLDNIKKFSNKFKMVRKFSFDNKGYMLEVTLSQMAEDVACLKSSKEQYVDSFNRIIAFSEFVLIDIYGFLK
jgi:hypothetical protein